MALLVFPKVRRDLFEQSDRDLCHAVQAHSARKRDKAAVKEALGDYAFKLMVESRDD